MVASQPVAAFCLTSVIMVAGKGPAASGKLDSQGKLKHTASQSQCKRGFKPQDVCEGEQPAVHKQASKVESYMSQKCAQREDRNFRWSTAWPRKRILRTQPDGKVVPRVQSFCCQTGAFGINPPQPSKGGELSWPSTSYLALKVAPASQHLCFSDSFL